MPDLRITLDGEPMTVPVGSTAGDVVTAAGGRAVAVLGPDRRQRDLAWAPADGDILEALPAGSEEGRSIIRHSTAHVLAQAVTDLFPDAKWAIGPPIENGFYYDFDVARPFTPDDVERIEARMREILAADQTFTRRVVSREEAAAEFADQPYKLDVLAREASGDVDDADMVEAGGTETTVYDNHERSGELAWSDLCRGPHVPSTGWIPAFTLLRTAGAYWRGDEKNPMLQRIYGTAWESPAALEEHLRLLREAEARDHRRLGAELDLFSFPTEIGSGLAVFHPKGAIVRRTMEDYSRVRHEQAGYDFVYTPHITKAQLFATSGHLDWYADGMFPAMHLDEERGPDGSIRRQGQDYYLKPMNCPFHNLVFRSRGRSYRELPLRLFEFGSVYRYEKSGVVHGLTRVRGMTQDDAHIYCTPEQMPGELADLLTFVLDLLRDFGLTDFYLELSTRDPEKSIGSDEVWERATAALADAAAASGLELVPDPGGAAFYGPKISVQVRDAIGRSWQMSTIQVDFNLPERFELEYQAADGSRERPVMIHRALFGSIERFFGILVEHYAGAFPAWLAPVAVRCVPIAERHQPYLQMIADRLRGLGVRTELDTTDERMQKKIARARNDRIPFVLVAGDRDVEAGAVSLRYRTGIEKRGVPIDEAVAEIAAAIAEHRVDVEPEAPAEHL